MYGSDIINHGYETGTFKLGQTVYHVGKKTHIFRLHKQCVYCNCTGEIAIRGKIFKCPACGSLFDYFEVIEKVVDEKHEIRSIITFKDKKKSFEIYATEENFLGLIIQKQNNETNNFYGSKEEAQEVCNKYNKENNVFILLDEYKRRELKESI